MVIRTFEKDDVTYWIALPVYPVNLFVDYFMVCHGVPSFGEEYIFPNNRAEIFFNLGDINYGITNENKMPWMFRESIVSGPRNHRLTIRPGKIFSLAGIRFNIFGFQDIFRIPSYEFTNRNFAGAEIWSENLGDLREQLFEERSADHKFVRLNDWIESKITLHNIHEAHVWNRLTPKLKDVSIPLRSSLSWIMGYSAKHTTKLFKERCGLPPKMIQRIFRFNDVLLRAQNSTLHWTRLCHDAGFSDQSHFIKDFKQFTGFTPKMFLKRQPKDWFLLRETR